MATYGIEFYGLAKYGPDILVDYKVTPFTATPTAYDRISLRWNSPAGAWTTLRLLRSWTGFSVDENDGEVLAEWDAAAQSTIDSTVRPGAWHYYTLYLLPADGTWARVGTVATLATKDSGYSDRLFQSLPRHHRFIPRNDGYGSVDENEALRSFLEVLGWGLDDVKTYLDSLRHLNNPSDSSLWGLRQLATQFGIEYEPAAPSRLFRQRVRNAGTLGREKGTLEQIQTLISLTTGYDVDLTLSTNLLLNEDTASFLNPQYPMWDQSLNYAKDERVKYNGKVYQCNTTGAYGLSQAPSGTSNDNTWWTCARDLLNLDPSLRDKDGLVAGWEAVSFTAGVEPSVNGIDLGYGVGSMTDADVDSNNMLYVRNDSGVTADLGAKMIGKPVGAVTLDPSRVLRMGVPVPLCHDDWSADQTYLPRDLTRYLGYTYRAVRRSLNVPPSGTTSSTREWDCVGLNGRVMVTASSHVLKSFGTTNGVPWTPLMSHMLTDYYSAYGTQKLAIDSDKDYGLQHFDSFATRSGSLDTRAFDFGDKTWSVKSGQWFASNTRGNGTAWTNDTGISTVTGEADGWVGVTFDTAPMGSAYQALIFRGSADLTTYLEATRDKLYTVNGSTRTAIGTYSTPFADKDRMKIKFVGTSITVYRNAASVLTATSTFSQTGTLHGMKVG